MQVYSGHNVPKVLKPDPTHLDPNGQKFVDPSGRPLYFDPGQPGKPKWGGKPHWHDPNNFMDNPKQPTHLPPGTEIPDPAPLPVPWWKKLPLLIPDPFPIIIDPCVIDPSMPFCKKPCQSA